MSRISRMNHMNHNSNYTIDTIDMNKPIKAQKLLEHIGQIDDYFIEEAEAADTAIASDEASRKRLVRYGALTAAFGLAVTYWWVRSKPTA